jgi:hypothetical protein
MTQPLPANNPVYRSSIFPNAVDQITNENPEIADAIMATQAKLLGLGPAGGSTTMNGSLLFTPDLTYNIGASGANRPANLYAGTIYSQGLVQIGAGAPLGFVSGSSLYSGSGAPATGLGAVGDYYFRSDTPGTSLQRIYVKTAAATWTGIV